jgi:hypothetical protein
MGIVPLWQLINVLTYIKIAHKPHNDLKLNVPLSDAEHKLPSLSTLIVSYDFSFCGIVSSFLSNAITTLSLRLNDEQCRFDQSMLMADSLQLLLDCVNSHLKLLDSVTWACTWVPF